MSLELQQESVGNISNRNFPMAGGVTSSGMKDLHNTGRSRLVTDLIYSTRMRVDNGVKVV